MNFLCIFSHKDETLAYGYPAFSLKWLHIKRCQRCGRIQREWDDLFAPSRPDSFIIEKSYMQTDLSLTSKEIELVSAISKVNLPTKIQQ